MLLAFKVTKASKEKRENEEKVGISSRELTPSASLEDQSLGNSARKFY